MAKTKRKPRMTKRMKQFASEMSNVQNLTVRDFQRNCLVRGMGFQELMEADMNLLRIWLFRNRNAEIKPELLDEFDKWKESELIKVGIEGVHPLLKLGFFAGEDEDGNVKTRRIKGINKPKKPKREKTDLGIYSGTKKALTYELAIEGKNLEEIKETVMEVFPDAKPKSINIWYKRVIKEIESKA